VRKSAGACGCVGLGVSMKGAACRGVCECLGVWVCMCGWVGVFVGEWKWEGGIAAKLPQKLDTYRVGQNHICTAHIR